MKLIPLTQGQFAKVDDDDFTQVSVFKWCATRNGNNFYAMRNASRNSPGPRRVYLHRVLMGNPVGLLVDHINRDTMDCRRANLRLATKIKNGQNRNGSTVRSKSGIRGVSWCKMTNRWSAEIQVEGSRIRLGRFTDIEDAAAAYASANREHFGEFGGGL